MSDGGTLDGQIHTIRREVHSLSSQMDALIGEMLNLRIALTGTGEDHRRRRRRQPSPPPVLEDTDDEDEEEKEDVIQYHPPPGKSSFGEMTHAELLEFYKQSIGHQPNQRYPKILFGGRVTVFPKLRKDAKVAWLQNPVMA